MIKSVSAQKSIAVSLSDALSGAKTLGELSNIVNRFVSTETGEFNRRMRESWAQHRAAFQQAITEYYFETANWRGGRHQEHHFKGLPYSTFDSLIECQRLGAILFHQSKTARNIHENLNNYQIGTGHTYEVAARKGANPNQSIIDAVSDSVDDLLSQTNWLRKQTDFNNRTHRTGDVIRVCEPTGNSLDVFWHEAHLLKPPPNGNDKAPFGIEFENNRVSRPKTFYLAPKYNVDSKAIPAFSKNRVVLWSKAGVDENDPRGIPLLLMAYCDCREIDDVDSMMHTVAEVLARHVAVYEYGQQILDEVISEIADGIEDESLQDRLLGNKTTGGIQHAKGYSVNLNGAQINATQWDELIASKTRRVAAIANIPEFMVTGDAETGNRSSLLSAENPLMRRISRETNMNAQSEMDVFYVAATVRLNQFGNQEFFRQLKSQVLIKPNIPIAEDQDKDAHSERIERLMDKGYLDPQTGLKELNRDYETVMNNRAEHARREAEFQRDAIAEGNILGINDAQWQAKIETLVKLANSKLPLDLMQIAEQLGFDPIEDRPIIQNAIGGFLPAPNDQVVEDVA